MIIKKATFTFLKLIKFFLASILLNLASLIDHINAKLQEEEIEIRKSYFNTIS